MSKYFTTKEAAEKLHVHPDTLRRWVKEGGRFSHLNLKETAGGHKRYSEEDLEILSQEISTEIVEEKAPVLVEAPENAQAYSCKVCEGSGKRQGYVCTQCRGTGTYWLRSYTKSVFKNGFIQKWEQKGRVDDLLAFSILAPFGAAACVGFLIIGLGLAIGGEGEPPDSFVNFIAGIMFLFMAFLGICALLFVYGIFSKIVFKLSKALHSDEIEVVQRGEQVGNDITWEEIATLEEYSGRI